MTKLLIEWRAAHNMTQTEAAGLFGVAQGTFAKWEAGQVPAEKCLTVHRITGINLHQLRPDVYPAPMRRSTDRQRKEKA